MKNTIPGIFLIESNNLTDEKARREERHALEEILRLAGRTLEHHYIRTRKELDKFIDKFHDSKFRYLHLACHGNKNGIGLTFDFIPFNELAKSLAPAMDDRRLFISACDGTRRVLAEPLFQASSCYSVIGPRGDITFHDAAIAWAAFYSLMAKANIKTMKNAQIRCQLQAVCNLFRVPFNAFFRKGSAARLEVFGPVKTHQTG